MPSILDALPGQAQKDELFEGFKTAFQADVLGLDRLQTLDIHGLASTFPVDDLRSFGIGTLPQLPTLLSKNSVFQQVQQQLELLKSINADVVISELRNSPLNTLAKPRFKLNESIGEITNVLLPTINVAPPKLKVSTFGQELLDFAGMNELLNQLSQAGVTVPMRLLKIMLSILDTLVNTLSDTDKLVAFTTQSLQEAYLQQIETLDVRLPLVALENAIALCEAADKPDSFAAQYKLLLDEIEILGQTAPSARLQKLSKEAGAFILPALKSLGQTRTTLELLKANNDNALGTAIKDVLTLNAADGIFLQKYLDQFSSQAAQILQAIATPISQIQAMAQQIQQYLEKTVTTAGETAKSFVAKIETTLHRVGQWVQEIESRIHAIQEQIESFVSTLDISAIISRAKLGCSRIGEGVDRFFAQIEALKQKLDQTVSELQPQVDEKVTALFQQLESKIRELLEQIRLVLDREDVQRALKQARDGIERFKNEIDQVSLKPVFDLVVEKTSKLETNINNLNVARLNFQQRTALKVGAKIIEEIKVDEIIKPELLEEFEEIRAPLAALIELLTEKVLVLEREIYQFDPGALATELLVNSGPYQLFIEIIESFSPSKLLEPLKALNNEVANIVLSLDPNKLVDEVQALYDKLSGLTEVLNPTQLNRMVTDAMNSAVSQLSTIRDVEMERILQTVQESISVERLLAGTGIQQIADAELWQMLMKVLSGDYVNLVKQAMNQAESKLEQQSSRLISSQPVLRLQSTLTNIDRQLIVDAQLIGKRIGELKKVVNLSLFNELQARQQRLLARYANDAEVCNFLHTLDLTPVLTLETALDAISTVSSVSLNEALNNLAKRLRLNLEELQLISASTMQVASVQVFNKQIGDPIFKLMEALEAELAPFKEAGEAVKGIVDAVLALPTKVDEIVSTTLTPSAEAMAAVITQIISNIEAFAESIVQTLQSVYAQTRQNVDKLSPAWLLNAFGEGDFSNLSSATSTLNNGLQRMAARIVNGADKDDVRLAALLQTHLTADEFAVLQAGVTRCEQDATAQLPSGARYNVCKALNLALADKKLLDAAYLDAIKLNLENQLDDLEKKLEAALADEASTAEDRIEIIKQRYHLGALQKQISTTETNYRRNRQPRDLLRLNRLLLEACYQDDIGMSLQSLHPYIVEQIADLYPRQTVQRLDNTYSGVVEKVKQLPDQLIRVPLGDTFDEIKQVLKDNFDIAGIFTVLEVKMDGIDEDLSEGLDRLSAVYNQLLRTFDQRLSEAG